MIRSDSNSRQRSVSALLISGIVHLCCAIILTFVFYKQIHNDFEDTISAEIITKKQEKQKRVLKRPPPKRLLTPKHSEKLTEYRPQHVKLTASDNLIDETVRPSKKVLMHSATDTVADVQQPLPEVTTYAKTFNSRARSISEAVQSPFKVTDGDGVKSVRQRVQGEGGDGLHRLESTGTAEVGTIGDGSAKKGQGGDGGENNITNPFAEALKQIADHIINTREVDKVNVVFVVDTSASMRNNIQQVAKNLYSMSDAFDLANLEYHFGMSEFSVRRQGQEVRVRTLRPDVGMLRREMQSVRMSGDEHALDALIDTLSYIEFHADAAKHVILVTDEPATTRMKKSGAYTTMTTRVMDNYKLEEISINVLGHPEPFQQQLAEITGGLWQLIPGGVNSATTLPSTRVGNQPFLKVFRDIATDIRRNGGKLLFSLEAKFDVTLEDGNIPTQKLIREFKKHGIELKEYLYFSEDATLKKKHENDLWVMTDHKSGLVYTIRKVDDKLNVYGGIYPESWNLNKNLNARVLRQDKIWRINDQENDRMYTIRSEKDRLNIYGGGQPGIAAADSEPIVDIAIMLDYSQSMGGRSQAIMLGLSTLLGRLEILPIKYRVGLIRFAEATDTIKVINGAVVAQMPLNEAILQSLMEDPFGGDERLIDAIVEGLPKMRFSPYASRFLLILTDEQTTGNYPAEQAIQLCQSLGLRAYVVGHPNPDDFQSALVKRTGGLFFEMPKYLKKTYPNQ